MTDSAPVRVLVVDDDDTFRKALSGALRRRGCDVTTAGGGSEALAALGRAAFDAAIFDLRMPDMDGLTLLATTRLRHPGLPVIMLTGHGTIPSAIEAIKQGAFHYHQKPCEIEEIEATLAKAVEQTRVAEEVRRQHEALRRQGPYAGMVGASPAIRGVIALIEKTKDAASPVLIEGESGTGKELVARALHFNSRRREHPFVVVNCASLKPDLLENELFGHVEGAFTGALRAKPGLLEMTSGGSLFVDEIADMNPSVQAALLRVVETGVFRPLGSTREKQVDVRIIAAANRDLRREVDEGRFRRDLLYRLNVVRIRVPPLRERREDIPLLIEHFLGLLPAARDRAIRLTPAAVAELASRSWPGNVRELRHVLERAALLSPGGETDAADFASLFDSAEAPERDGAPVTLDEAEARHIREMLKREGGNVSRVAQVLGIDRRTLQRKMARYGLRESV